MDGCFVYECEPELMSFYKVRKKNWELFETWLISQRVNVRVKKNLLCEMFIS